MAKVPNHQLKQATGPERVEAADLLVLTFDEPITQDDLENIIAAIRVSPPITPTVVEAYIAYDDGFGHVVRKGPIHG